MLLSKCITARECIQLPQQQQQQRRSVGAVSAAAARHGSHSTPPPPGVVTKWIKNASSTVELLQLHASYRGTLDGIHYAALFNKLLQTSPQQQQHQGRSLNNEQWLAQHQPLLQHQQRHPQQHRALLLQALLADLPGIVPSMQPGPLVVVLRALTKLHAAALPDPQLLQALLHHAHRNLGFQAFSPRELCTFAQALAELQPVDVPWTTTTAAARGATARLQQQQRSSEGATASSSLVNNSISSSRSCWDPVLLQDLFCALGLSLQHCNAQDTAQAVLAVAQLRYVPSEPWLQLWLVRANQLLPQFTPQGLSNAAYGLVRALQLMGQLRSSSSSSYEWAVVMTTNSSTNTNSAQRPQQQLPQQHSQQQQEQEQEQSELLAGARSWLQSCLKVSVLHRTSFKQEELIGQLLWAAGTLSCTVPEPARHHLLTSAQALLPRCDARHLCAALYAFAMCGMTPDEAAARVLWSRLADQVLDISPGDLAQALWSAGKLQLQPPRRVRGVLQQQALALVAEQQSPRYLVGVLRGMVTLGWQLQDKYVVRFQGAFLEQLEGSCVPQDYANMLWALAAGGAKVEARCGHRFCGWSQKQRSCVKPVPQPTT